MSEELPQGWVSAPLSVLGSWLGGGTPSKAVPGFWEGGTIPWVSPKDMKRLVIDSTQDQITEQALAGSATNLVPPYSVLMVTRSGILEHTFPVAVNAVPVTINQDLKAWTPKGVDSRYAAYYLRARQQDVLRECSKDGTTVSSIDFDQLAKFPMRVAPLSEQQRIVSRIEELFSEIDEGERALQRVGRLVERYRQSVLKAAVTGELTREWRQSGRAARAAAVSSRIATDTLGALPQGWDKCRIDEVGEVQLGRQRSPEHHQGEHMRPYLRVANVYEERIDTSDLMSMNFTPEEFERFRLRHGDILLNEGQSKELVGRPAMYRGELPDGCFTNSLVRFRAGDRVLPAFALTVFLHFMKSGDFQRIARVTTNIAHLGAGRFAEMAFSVPPMAEQQLIVDAVARQDSMWRAVAAEVGARSRQSGALRQAVLKAAFSGQLVPQDPSDEPAAALLARLAAHPGEAPTTRKRGGRPRRQPATT